MGGFYTQEDWDEIQSRTAILMFEGGWSASEAEHYSKMLVHWRKKGIPVKDPTQEQIALF